MDNLLRILDQLPKYIGYNNSPYPLIIQKNDWDGHDYSWKFFYAKETKHGFSTTKPLVFAQGKSFSETLNNFEKAFQMWKKEHKDDPKVYRV